MKKLTFALLITFAFSVGVQAANQDTVKVSDLRNHVYDFLNDADRTFWTTTIVDRFLDLSAREYAMWGGIERVDTISTVNDQTEYELNSDFLRVRGVVIKDGTRLKSLQYRAMRSGGINQQTLGKDNAPSSGATPKYYSVFGGKDGNNTMIYYLSVDPPESDGTTYSLYVFYYAQSVDLTTSDATITNIPYSAVPLVVYNAVKMCYMMNREDNFTSKMIPIVSEMYKAYLALLVAEKSDPNFIPTERPR